MQMEAHKFQVPLLQRHDVVNPMLCLLLVRATVPELSLQGIAEVLKSQYRRTLTRQDGHSWNRGLEGGLLTNQQRHLSMFYQSALLQEPERAERQPSSPLRQSLPPHTLGAGPFHSFLPHIPVF